MKQIPLTKIGFFNPGRLTDEEIEQMFITRVLFFEHLFKKIIAEKPGSIPQHYLIIGQRGMGKTSLLIRISAELRKKPYNDSFIALTFPEEQYNVDRLSKFWLNCMDALADALDKETNKEHLTALDDEIKNLSNNRNTKGIQIFNSFKKWTEKIKRRPVLLVDNLNLIFNKIDKDEQHQLRAVLMDKGAPILVGASTTTIEETVDYGAPFYDAFQIIYLKKLSFEESMDVLINLARITGNKNFEKNVYQHKGRLEALYQLTGGTPRTLAILFPLIQGGFSETIQTDLDAILDAVTPLYKARFEELSHQLQVVLDAIALNWDPITLKKLRDITHLDNAQLSPQLKRLVDVGWLQKLDAYKAKGGAYELNERFFNIWYLMRRSSRRQKRELYCLTKFLETFYGDDLHELARGRIKGRIADANYIALNLAMADAVRDKKIGRLLKKKSYKALFDISVKDKEILKQFDIPNGITKKKINDLWEESNNLLDKNKFANAEDSLLKILNIDDNYKYAWNRLGIIYHYDLERYVDAENAYKKTISLDEKDGNPWVGLGNLYQDYLGRYEEAEDAYKKAINLDEKDGDAWCGLGNLYQDYLGRYVEAEVAYKKAINLNEKDGDAWCGLGNLYQNYLGRYVEAEVAYKKAINFDEKNAYPWNELGNLYQNYLGRYGEAEVAYKKAISLDEKDAYPWNELGNLYQIHLERYEEAELVYKKAINLDEKDAHPWYGLGNLYQDDLGKYVEAELAYKKAISLDEKSGYPWNGLGNLYGNSLGRYEEAEEAFKMAISLDEKLAFPWLSLGYLYSNFLGRFEEAEEAYKKAISLDKKDAYSWNELGNLYQDQLERYAEAELAYKKAIELEPKSKYQKYNMVFLLRDKMHKITEAKQLFSSISIDDKLKDSYRLNESLFSFYDKNIGIAIELLQDAIEAVMEEKLPVDTKDDWYRSAAVIVKLGYGESLLKVFINNNWDVIMRPLYVAIEALTNKDEEHFLNSVAAEVREPAKIIMNMMKNYMK